MFYSVIDIDLDLDLDLYLDLYLYQFEWTGLIPRQESTLLYVIFSCRIMHLIILLLLLK